ncbi:T9SS type A sorting domain-containing protein [Spirosoma validum]|uniref:T9SS type A sorting domain-containing protein n=1 Tax=Spirosoma validum TaxID=2771355 RepID=A0A927B968_9BACT|nr:T9SS type A sorting domain-containing protein [Spirosoma validum]MBD2757501.1 T9SS type A sorting domain-containing protein [Spirosoma validum]
MKKALRMLLGLWLVAGSLNRSWAQCPAASSYATSTTAATCPSNGVIQLTNPADVAVSGGRGVPEAVYTITAGPAGGGYQTTGQSANQFQGLPPGTYTVTVSKPGCPDVVVSGITVNTTYTPISLIATVSNICANGQPGGTINASASGGLAPIQYAFVQSPNANIADNLLTYGPASSTATGGYGLFQVRAKDGCGVFTTNTVDVEPIAKPAYFTFDGTAKDCQTYGIKGNLSSTSDNQSVSSPYVGTYTLEFFDITATNPCAIPGGATPFKTIQATSQSDLNFDLAKTHGKFVVRTTGPCGDVTTFCYDLASTLAPIVAFRTAPSCQQFNGTNGTDIQLKTGYFAGPGSITISSAGPGNPVLATGTFSQTATETTRGVVFPVAYDPQGYLAQVTDACGVVYSYTITTPPGAGDAVTADVFYTNLECANQIGAKQTWFKLTGGVKGLFDSGSSVQVVAGPSGPISPAIQAFPIGDLDIYKVRNLPPGTYTAQINTSTTGCGPTSFTFAVPPNSPSSPGLTYNLTGSVQAFCGGTGSLAISFNWNGGTDVTYTVTNSSGQAIASNTSGVFTNLPADTYTVTASATTYCDNNFTQTKTFTIPGPNSVPVIEKKVGIICENGNTATATGQALFRFTGFAPYQFEISPSGTNSWSTIATGITASDYVVSNLAANATYDFRLTDNCGKSTVTTVSIKPLDAQTVENTLNPCNGQNYTLSAADFPGATYSWTKDGNPISTNREITFSPYQSINNGQYVVTITLPQGCVVRTSTANLNSGNCGGPLPVNLIAFDAKLLADQTVQLDWVTASEQNNAYFELERSKDLVAIEPIGRVMAAEGKALSGHNYRYVDTQPQWGTSYYRLRQVDQSGASVAYPWQVVVIRDEAYGVMPNPVLDQRFSVSLDEPQTAKVQLFGADGRQISLDRNALSSHRLELRPSSVLPAGVYVLLVEERGQSRSHRLIVAP